jgi:two-component system, NtrC family, nitrogen regulation sensor histidine kinase GlnL
VAVARSRLIAVPSGPTPEALIAAMPGALIVLDPDGCVSGVNSAAEMLLNASAAHLLHKPLGIILKLPESCLAGLRDDSVFAAYDCVIETQRGHKLNVDFHANPLPEHEGWRLISLNSAASAQAMGERRSGVRAATGAAAMLAHEIKNPLSGIRGAAQLLDKAVGEDGNALTKLIRDEVDRIATLIDRMEAFTDGRPLRGRPENIYSILDHVRALAESGFGDKIDIRDSYDPSLPSVLVDRDSMIQIVLNLLKNAAEAVPSGKRGVVTLTTGYRHGVSIPSEGGRRLSVPIELCVIDDGPGPPPRNCRASV